MFRFREGLTYLSPAPLYHSAPQASVSATIRMGGTAVIMEKFDPAQFLDLVARAPRHALADGADDVLAAAQAARRRAGRGRPVVARVHHPRGGAVPGAGEAADDRVVRPEDHRVLRRHRGERLHVLRLRGVARSSRHRRQVHPRRAPDPRRRRQRAADGHARHGVVQGRHELRVLQRSRQDGRVARRRRATPARSATSATSTRTATCTSPTARRT